MGFGKVAGIGLASVFALLVAMSVAGVVLANSIPGPLEVKIPEADLTGVKMYGGSYPEGSSNPVPVVVQEVDSLSCPLGQTITRTMTVAGVKITATISMDKAELSEVLMKARTLTSSSGDLSGVTLETQQEPLGLLQTVSSGTMNNLEAEVYFVSMTTLGYEGLGIEITVG
mgnify:CR=1 FL=1